MRRRAASPPPPGRPLPSRIGLALAATLIAGAIALAGCSGGGPFAAPTSTRTPGGSNLPAGGEPPSTSAAVASPSGLGGSGQPSTPTGTPPGSGQVPWRESPAVPVAPLQLRRVIDSQTARPAVPFQAFDAFTMNIADLRGDGRLQLVTLNDNLHAYVFDPATGELLAELATAHPGQEWDLWQARDINGVAIGDVSGDGALDLVVLNSAATLTLFEQDPTAPRLAFSASWSTNASAAEVEPDFFRTHPWFTPASNTNGTTNGTTVGADGHPFILHLPTGPLILVQSDGFPGHFAYNANGTLRWMTSWWEGNAGPWAGTLTQGGPPLAIFASDSGHVVAYKPSGAIQWVFNAREHGATPGSMPVPVSVQDLRGDGNRSVFVGARHAVNDTLPGWMQRQHARYFLLDAAGHLKWQANLTGGNPLYYMHPVAHDVDGDGVKDLLVLDWNTIGHHPGNWEKTGPANLFALDGRTGRVLWNTTVDSAWSNKGIVLADFVPETPGLEILVEDQWAGSEGLALYSAQNGTRLAYLPLPARGWSIMRAPTLADLDADGTVEAVVPVARNATGCLIKLDVGCRDGAILVYGTQATLGSVAFANNARYDSLDEGAVAAARVAPPVMPAKTTMAPGPR